jgi:NAD(P)-dependent dehydrogenase (short-subunit alcohol dehydrogenase family)
MKAWFVTGASRGLGHAITRAALERGDQVAAAARDTRPLRALADRFGDTLLPLPLDVTDRDAVRSAVDRAHVAFGQLDVVVNNAGHGLLGAIEEATEAEARRMLDTNVLGPMWVAQAALPHLRAQGRGHIVQVSSVAGVAAFPMIGLYCASKWALEGLSESLAQEVAEFGIRVTMVEPGAMRTDWPRHSMARAERPLDAYKAALEERLGAMSDEYDRRQPGDPRRAAEALLTIVDADEPPLRLLMGNGAFDLVISHQRAALDEWRDWERLSRSTDFT